MNEDETQTATSFIISGTAISMFIITVSTASLSLREILSTLFPFLVIAVVLPVPLITIYIILYTPWFTYYCVAGGLLVLTSAMKDPQTRRRLEYWWYRKTKGVSK